jgi:hypothetical protein
LVRVLRRRISLDIRLDLLRIRFWIAHQEGSSLAIQRVGGIGIPQELR